MWCEVQIECWLCSGVWVITFPLTAINSISTLPPIECPDCGYPNAMPPLSLTSWDDDDIE